jgi:steroid delta-isomerase-like uncharacterized protein
MRLPALPLAVALLAAPCAGLPAGVPDNARTATRVFAEVLGQGRVDHLNEIYGPGFVAHAASFNYTLEQNTAATLSWRTALPDLEVKVERTVADREMVAVHWRVVGTNTVAAGELPGKGDRIGAEGMTIFRFAAGRIVEEWSVVDVATLRKQLGQ